MKLRVRRRIMPAMLGVFVLLSWGAAQSSAVPVLQITKVDDVDPVIAGEDVTYTITVTNTGDQPASNVTVDDTLPSGFSVVSVSSSSGGCAALPCNLGMMPSSGPNSSQTVSVVAQVPANTAAGTYINTASVDSDDTSAISTFENTTVAESAALSVTKTDSPDPVMAGETLNYTIVVTNSGPSTADLVTVSDTLPAEVTFVTATVTAPDPTASCTGGATLTCSLGTLTPSGAGSVATVTVVVDVSAASGGSTLSNAATVDSEEPQSPVTSSAATTSVTSSADLTILKTDDPDPVAANSLLSYTVTVTNTGPSDAQSVEMQDNLPSGTTFVSVSGPGTCAGTPTTVSCSLASLSGVSPNNVAVWTIVAQVSQVGGSISDGVTLTNTATVSSATTDPNTASNTDSETTGVAAPVVTLTKSSDPPSGSEVSSGQVISFTITYSNQGGATATSLVINDPVSTFLSDVIPANGGFYDPDTRTISWSVGDVPPGVTGTVSFTARVGSSAGRELILNRANATASELTNRVVSNRTEHELIPPDIRIDKGANLAENSVVRPGQVVTYELDVRNRGGKDNSAVITDAPPQHMIYVPGSTRVDGAPVSDVGGTSPLFASGVVLNLDKNERRTITFQMVVGVTAPAGGLIENWGYATSSGGDVSADFFGLRVLRPTTGPALRQSILVQTAEGQTIFVTVFNTVVGLLPVTGYEVGVLALLGLSSIGIGRSLVSRVAADLMRRGDEDE